MTVPITYLAYLFLGGRSNSLHFLPSASPLTPALFDNQTLLGIDSGESIRERTFQNITIL